MRLLQLSLGSGEQLDMHPNVTVVTGLEAATHRTLLEAVSGLARLEAPPVGGLLEAHGVLFDLDPALLRTIELAVPDVDPIVRRGELPEEPLSADALELRTREEAFAALLARISERVELQAQARAEVRATSLALDEARRAAAQAQAQARADVEVAAEGVGQAEAQVASEPGADATSASPGPEAPAAGHERLEQVEHRIRELDQLLSVLTPVEPSGVREALAVLGATEGAQGTEGTDTVPSSDALRVADQLDDVETELEGALDAAAEVDAAGLAEARAQLDDARQALLEAEQSARNPTLDGDDVMRLEQAHEALLEAIDRADGRFAGARARQRVVTCRGVEQEVLDRLGFTSYPDYMIGYSHLRQDPAKQEALDSARAEVAAAESRWRQLKAATDAALVRAALLDRRRALLEQAAELLDRPAGEHPQGALRELRVPAATSRQAATRLQEALAGVGLDLGDEELEDDELSLMATAWLAEADRLDERRRQVMDQRKALDEEREAIALGRPDRSAGPRPSATRAPEEEPETTPEALSGVHAAQARARPGEAGRPPATAALGEDAGPEARHADALARLDEQDAALAALDAEGQAAALEIERLQDVVAAQAGERATPADELEWYLLARLAAQRSVSVAGSAPLLLDDALRDLAAAEVDHLLDRLEAMAEAVQVIIVSDDPHVAEWATAAGPGRAAVVRPVPTADPALP